MKNILKLYLLLLMFVSWSGCTPADQETSLQGNPQQPPASEENDNEDSHVSDTLITGSDGRYLIVYCSRSGNTRKVAYQIQSELNCDLLEIQPEEPYEDDYNAMLDRAEKELAEIKNGYFPPVTTIIPDLSEYQTIFVGYPIWYGSMATTMQSFLHEHASELSHKRIALFATSGSSSMTTSILEAQSLCPKADFVNSTLLLTSSTLQQMESHVHTWITEINNTENENNNNQEDQMKSNKIRLTVGQNSFTATLADNPATEALKARLAQNDLSIQMSDYGNMEKVGTLGFSLPQNDRQITTGAGDIVLYLGHSLVIFYGSNTWSYTPIGKVDDATTKEEMLNLLGTDSHITVTLSLE